jgi:hypothetical protein
MAAFIAMTSWRGEFTDEYFAQAAPDPAHFGLPVEDDGSRDNPLPFADDHSAPEKQRRPLQPPPTESAHDRDCDPR